MIQIGAVVMAVGLVFAGLRPLLGLEKSKQKTHPAVAVTMLVIAVALVVFAFVFLPRLLATASMP